MTIKKCTLEDCPTLGILNRHLIEDEKHDNPMGPNELRHRMEEFLKGEYDAYFYLDGDEPVGYALVKNTTDPIYLRQFFISREKRRKGYGRAFFFELLKTLKASSIDIEVLTWNQPGVQFWQSLGFAPRSIYMRYQSE